jgi:hypothetical protein
MVVAPKPFHLGLHGAKPQLQAHFYDFEAICSGGNSILEILKPEDKVWCCILRLCSPL